MPPPATHIQLPRPPETHGLAAPAPDVIAVREGATIPQGYKYVVREDAPIPRSSSEMVDLTTPPDGAPQMNNEDMDFTTRMAAERRKATRSTNKQAHASFVKEVKESMAEGRLPAVNVREDQTHLKARWHAAAKDAAYKLLDLTKEGWKDYNQFEKSRVYQEINTTYKFEPPLDPKRIDKYLAGHLRSSRAVWKAHWQRHGSDNRHPNCPEEAWQTLIQWWPTEACKEVAAAMAQRRSMVQNASKTGRKRIVDRMAEEVRIPSLLALFICCNVYLCRLHGNSSSGPLWMSWTEYNPPAHLFAY